MKKSIVIILVFIISFFIPQLILEIIEFTTSFENLVECYYYGWFLIYLVSFYPLICIGIIEELEDEGYI